MSTTRWDYGFILNLIFDKATSALDNKTQKSISDFISQVSCTRIVIAHRLSIVKNANRIIMLEGGKIIEEGNYQTLIDKKGKFAEFVNRQRLDNKWWRLTYEKQTGK